MKGCFTWSVLEQVVTHDIMIFLNSAVFALCSISFDVHYMLYRFAQPFFFKVKKGILNTALGGP